MRPTRWTALLGLALFPLHPLRAQWSVGLSLGVARYYGGAVSVVDSTPGEVHPYRPTTLTLVVGHEWGRIRGDLGFSYGSPGLAAEIPGGAFIVTKGTDFISGVPEVSVRVLRIGAGGVLRLAAGGDFTVWRLTDFETRMLVGGHVAALYEWPIAGPLLGSIQGGVSLSPSLFRAAELDPSFERRMMLRPSLSIGVRYR